VKVPFVVGAFLVALVARPARAQTPDGQALYRENCRTCHGVIGKPTGMARHQFPKIPTLADSAFMAGISEDSIVAVITRGVGKDMKSFKGKLTSDEMKAVARYVRTLSGRPAHAP
jgi:cytochrome c oxidase cbb3-type subunit III